jgi:hypothetical protein
LPPPGIWRHRPAAARATTSRPASAAPARRATDPSGWTSRPKKAAIAAIRVKGHYLEAQYRRLKPRRGHKRALGAVKHTMLCAIWHMLSTGETDRDLGGDYYTNRDPERQTRRLVKQLERLGHHVTLQEAAAA